MMIIGWILNWGYIKVKQHYLKAGQETLEKKK